MPRPGFGFGNAKRYTKAGKSKSGGAFAPLRSKDELASGRMMGYPSGQAVQ
jgi:hypothetical protein